MSRNLISRRESIAVLYKILASHRLEEEDEGKIEDIIHCIEAELENYHEWGADTSEAVILHFPVNSRQIRSMEKDELRRIYKKFRFIPSETDKEETRKQVQHMLDLVYGFGNSDDSSK